MDGRKFYDVRARQALQNAFDYVGFIGASRGGDAAYTGPLSWLLTGLNQLGQEDYKRWLTGDVTTERELWAAAGGQHGLHLKQLALAGGHRGLHCSNAC